MSAAGVPGYVPVEDLGQRFRGFGRGGRRRGSGLGDRHPLTPGDAALGRGDRPQQIADGFGGREQIFGQPDAEGTLDSGEQFGETQTIDAQVAVQAGWRCEG